MATVKVTLVKSLNGRLANHKARVKGLGLRRISHTIKVQDTPGNRGVIGRTYYLLRVEGQSIQLNDLRSAPGARHEKHRPDRGIGNGLGKTGGRGHKGLTSRSGDKVTPGFKDGQQPLHRRLSKFGFVSLKTMDRAEVRAPELAKVGDDVVSLQTLKDVNLINQHIQCVKVMLPGEVGRAVAPKGIAATEGARMAAEAVGGKFKD